MGMSAKLKSLLAGAALALAVVISANVQAATIIDTTTGPTADGFSPFGGGLGSTATYGEVFTVSGPDTFLTTFSLYLVDKPSGGCVCGTLNLVGYLGAWDGQKVSNIL